MGCVSMANRWGMCNQRLAGEHVVRAKLHEHPHPLVVCGACVKGAVGNGLPPIAPAPWRHLLRGVVSLVGGGAMKGGRRDVGLPCSQGCDHRVGMPCGCMQAAFLLPSNNQFFFRGAYLALDHFQALSFQGSHGGMWYPAARQGEGMWACADRLCCMADACMGRITTQSQRKSSSILWRCFEGSHTVPLAHLLSLRGMHFCNLHTGHQLSSHMHGCPKAVLLKGPDRAARL